MKPISLNELLAEQDEDPVCQEFKKQSHESHSLFSIQENGVLVRTSPKDGSVQTVVPESLQPRVLYLGHYPILAGHPKTSRMYDSLRRKYYWPRMMDDVIQTSTDCRPCAEARGTRFKTQKPMKLFPAGKPLDFIAMDLLGPFPTTETGSTNILVITDRFSKLAQVTPLSSTTASAVANAFVENWVIPYGMPSFLLTDNGPQFVAKLFEAVCLMLGLKHVTTTAYHPQTNGQTERYNQTLAIRLRIFTDQHNKDWDRLIQPLTYAYNSQVHRTTNETPFSLVLTRQPPDIIVEEGSPLPSVEPMSAEETKLKVLERTKALVTKATERTTTQQQRYKTYHDRRVRSKLTLTVGDEVFVDNPPSTGQTPAERMADEPRGKLRKKTQKGYRVLQVFAETAKIVGPDGLEDIVSLDRLTVAPPPLDPQTLKPQRNGSETHHQTNQANTQHAPPIAERTDGPDSQPTGNDEPAPPPLRQPIQSSKDNRAPLQEGEPDKTEQPTSD